MTTVQSTLAIVALMSVLGCDDRASDAPEPAETSPNARIVPAPLLSGRSLVSRPRTSATTARGAATAVRMRPVPVPFSLTELPPGDGDSEPVAGGLVLTGEFRWPDRGRKTALHDLPSDEAADVRNGLRRTVTVDLSTYDRMRVELLTDAFPLPRGSALLARQDRKGHLLAWPETDNHRVVPEGAVRALLREHRLDVTPALSPLVEPGPNGHRFGSETEIVSLTTAHGKVRLEQLPVEELGYGGALLCRLLLEFIAASAPSEVCREDTVPVHAEFEFEPGGKLSFVVDEPRRKPDTTTVAATTAVPLAVPPERARFVKQGLPRAPSEVVPSKYLTALRAGPAGGPTGSARVRNRSLLTAYLLLDDMPIAIVPPRRKWTVSGLREGEYQLASVTFFGEVVHEPSRLTIPAGTNSGSVVVGKTTTGLDAGAE